MDPNITLEFEKKIGLFSIDAIIIKASGTERFLGIQNVGQEDKEIFFEILSRLGFKERIKDSDKNNNKSAKGCLLFFVPILAGLVVYGATKI